MRLTPKEEMFCKEYLVDLNGTQAAIRAGYSARSAKQRAYLLLEMPRICDRINELMRARAARVETSADEVLRELLAVMRADATAITEYRRTCCRYCYGTSNRYQRTRGEMERDREAHAKLSRDRIDEGKPPLDAFDEKGGTGWDPRRDPNQECEECFGEGHGRVRIRDTRTLVGDARRLFDGIKQGKDGIEAKIRDRTKPAELVGRHLGMWNDKLELSRPKVRVKDFTGRKKRAADDDDEAMPA